jgi:hypothetical protein
LTIMKNAKNGITEAGVILEAVPGASGELQPPLPDGELQPPLPDGELQPPLLGGELQASNLRLADGQ